MSRLIKPSVVLNVSANKDLRVLFYKHFFIALAGVCAIIPS